MKKQKICKMFCVILFMVGVLMFTNKIEAKAATPEAAIGNVTYETLQEALEAVKYGETIVLKKNIELSESIVICGCYYNYYYKYTGISLGLDWSGLNYRFTIDLNGKTILFNRRKISQWSQYIPALVIMDSNIDITIKNGTLKNLGTWDRESPYQDLLICLSAEDYGSCGGELILENVKCYGNIYNEKGRLRIRSGQYKGYITSEREVLTIEGGSFEGKIEENDNGINVSGGTFKNNVYSYGDRVNISGGTFYKSMYLYYNDEVKIKKGTFKNSDKKSEASLYIIGGKQADIFGGTFASVTSCIKKEYHGILNIKGGILKSTSQSVPILTSNAYASGNIKINVKGGTIYKSQSGTWYQDQGLASQVKVPGGRFVDAGKKIQTIKVSTETKKYQKAQLKKSKQSFYINATAKGKVSYKVISGDKYVGVNSKGKVTVKKGTPQGTYKVRVTAAATSKYEKETKVIKIIVK